MPKINSRKLTRSRKISRKQTREQRGGGMWAEYCPICEMPFESMTIKGVDTNWLQDIIGIDHSRLDRNGVKITYDLHRYDGYGACQFKPEQSNPAAKAIIDASEEGQWHWTPSGLIRVKKFHITNSRGDDIRDIGNSAIKGKAYHQACYKNFLKFDKHGEAKKKAPKAKPFQEEFFDWKKAYKTHGEELFESPTAAEDRCQGRCKQIKQNLVAKVLHPERVGKILEEQGWEGFNAFMEITPPKGGRSKTRKVRN